MADEPTFWDKVKDYVGIGLTKAKETGKYLKKTGREPATDIHEVASRAARTSTKKKSKTKKKK